MITEEEQQACDLWVKSAMAEFAGKPEFKVPATNSADGSSSFYDASEWKAMFRATVPTIAERILEAATISTNLWVIWPQLTEAELGIIMQAGAARFLPLVTEKT